MTFLPYKADFVQYFASSRAKSVNNNLYFFIASLEQV